MASSLAAACLVGCGKQPEAVPAATPKPTARVDAARITAADARRVDVPRPHLRRAALQPARQDRRRQRGAARPGVVLRSRHRHRGQEATPLVVDGVLYVTTAWSKVFALDAKTGKQLWRFDPKVPGEMGVNACCDVVNRGVAAWKGKIYLGTLDGRLIALDAATGKPVW